MNCPETRENLAAYLDDEIDGAPRRAMDAHFTTCADCAAERRAQGAAWALLDRAVLPPSLGADDPVADAAFRERLHARIAAGEGSPSGRLLRLSPRWLAAAGVLVAAGGAWALLRTGDGKPAVDGDPRIAVTTSSPSREFLADMALLEALDLLQDEDLRALDALSELDPDDLEVLGG